MTKIVEVGDCVVGCVANEASDGELVVDSNTGQSDFDSRIACKLICQRVKSLDGLSSKRGKCSFSSLMIAMKMFFKQCNYQFTISLTSKEIDGPNAALSADVALQITVVVKVCSKMTPLIILFPPIDPDLVGDRYLNGYVRLYRCPLPLLGPCVVMSQSPIWAMFY
jgi:hypothetical protein